MSVPERHRTQPGTRPSTPEQAWRLLAAGNARFMADERAHPHQDMDVRHRLALKQAPFAVFFGCGDSRVAAEIIFDQGLGDLFVVRTAGHVVDFSVLGSLEFGVGNLGAPLVVVLGHDSCGAVAAAIHSAQSGDMPKGYVRDIVERMTPSVFAAARQGPLTSESVEREHVRSTCELLYERSTIIRESVGTGRLAIVGCEYKLSEGAAQVVHVIGDIGGVDVIDDGYAFQH
ncbi:MAG: carbonic anhydrase [Nostocoides sp.]|uniref:carbonic anhydrase n=1 Tax=Nostocoides sp. TaxID=1917966 RepID=UPI003C789FB8